MTVTEPHPILKKLNYREHGEPVLIMNAPEAYREVIEAFRGEVHQKPQAGVVYGFAQAFSTGNEQLQALGRLGVASLQDDGLLWLCYPKKSSKMYKGSDTSRESVAALLASEGFEPVRQIAIDDDWSALRFRKVEQIKTMVRKSAVTEQGKARVGREDH